ncbi:MAG: DUF2165 domain-containing protein [Hyphomicrobiales bacterium]
MIELFASSDFPRTGALLAVSCWLTIAVINNWLDKPTNWLLLGTMMRQDLLKDEPVLGQGLKQRRILNPKAPKIALVFVIFAQVTIAILLWFATIYSFLGWVGFVDGLMVLAVINLAIGSFFGLWTIFLCGGLWFGYWIKSPQVQQVHFSLFIISLLLWQLAN